MKSHENESSPEQDPTSGEESGGAGLQAPASLLPQHRKQLLASGLNDHTIELAGVFSVESKVEAQRHLRTPEGAHVSVPALAFPYPGCDGYVRLRPDTSSRPNPDFFETRDHDYSTYGVPRSVEGPKYLSPFGSASRLYVPTGVCPGILNPQAKLWLVEGEKKALAGCQAGLATVAAPGVTCFGDSGARQWAKGIGKDVRRLHPDFDKLSVSGREVVVLFDSDIDENPKVLAAAAALGKMLNEAGAVSRIAYLDAAANGEKVGLDDFLVSCGSQAPGQPTPLDLLEETVRPFNVQECVARYLAPNWEGWSRRQQDAELGRAVRLACHLFEKKGDRDSWCKRTAKALQVSPERLQAFVVDVKKEGPLDPRVWVAEWMLRHHVAYSCRTQMLSVGGKQVASEAVFRDMALDAVTWGGPPRLSIDDAYSRWMDGQRELALERLRSNLAFRDVLGASAIENFILAATGKAEPVDVAVLKHFIWQVKRKLWGLPVEDHIMPILYGPQRSGKSRAISALLGPVQDFTDSPGNLADIADERQAFRMTQSFVLMFDEMAKARKMDVDSLKNRITQDTVRWRVLGTNRTATGPNNATFIGATNTNLLDLIYDPTGVRRFYQLKCQDHMDWDAINSLKYGDLWASVDEHGDTPVKAVRELLQARQEDMRVKDAVEEFLATRCVVGGQVWTPAGELYEAFKSFLFDDRRTKEQWHSSLFGRRLKELLGPHLCKKSDGIKYCLTVRSAQFDLGESGRPLVHSVAPVARA